MTIDWSHFTPWSSLGGGLLIGVAIVIFLLFSGRIAGISGVVGGLLRPVHGDIAWRIAFVAGIVAAPIAFRLVAPLPDVQISAGTMTLIAAGLLVGAGTRYGGGCTSGHGVCGLSRRSPRSIVATAAFMLAGLVTVYVIRHLIA